MKIPNYPVSYIQDGDLILGYRPGGIPSETYLFSGVGGGGVDSEVLMTTKTLTRSQVLELNTTPVTIVTGVTDYAISFAAPPIIRINTDGTPFGFASSQTVKLLNDSSIEPLMASFGDPFITTPTSKIFAGAYFGNHEIIAGDISCISTFAITGGGTNATFTFQVYYRLIPLTL